MLVTCNILEIKVEPNTLNRFVKIIVDVTCRNIIESLPK